MGLHVYVKNADVQLWYGGYGSFNKWRCKLAELYGIPNLNYMEGFYDESQLYFLNYVYDGDPPDYMQIAIDRLKGLFPLKWDSLKPNHIHKLLYHSDCDGIFRWSSCRRVADALEKLVPLLPDEDDCTHIGNWKETTQKFIDGLRYAYNNKKDVIFC